MTERCCALQQLERMVGPVVLQVPGHDPAMMALARRLTEAQPLIELEETGGPDLSISDGWGRPTGIYFRGLPQGQELQVLLDDLVAVSRGSTGLSPLGRMQARELPGGAQLWVLATPACLRCSQAARLAHAIAFESGGRLTATVVDVSERLDLIERFGATTVPWCVVNEAHSFAGPLPELLLIQRIADVAANQQIEG
jgi:hypothetical protein